MLFRSIQAYGNAHSAGPKILSQDRRSAHRQFRLWRHTRQRRTGIPAGVKATTEWFPAKERSVAIGWFNIGSSIGALLAPPLVVWALLHGSWHWAFVIVGALGVLWTALWMLFYRHPRKQPRLTDEERDYIVAGQEVKYSESGTFKRRWTQLIRGRDFWAIGIPRILSEPAWQDRKSVV